MAIAISDPAVKQDTIVDVHQQWQQTDAKAAAAWIKAQPVDAETKLRLEP